MFHYKTLEELKQEIAAENLSVPFGDEAVLREPVTVGGKTIANRIAIQPMEGCDGTADGKPDELTLRRYDKFAASGAGLIWEEATAVWEEGRANPRQLWIKEENLDAFRAMNDRIREISVKKHGFAPVIIMQATHSGRYSKPKGVPAPLIAYNNPLFEKDTPISQDRIVTDDAIMGDMHVCHEKVAVADNGDTVILHCSGCNGHVFTNHVIVTNHQAGIFPLILLILGFTTHAGVRKNTITFTDFGVAVNIDVRNQLCTRADFDLRANNAKRAHYHVVSQLGRRVH